MKRRIAVLMGGESRERDISRVTGIEVAKALSARGHSVTLVDTQKGPLSLVGGMAPRIGPEPPATVPAGTALAGGGPSPVVSLLRSLADVDVVFIALHGGWGEDGTLQALFDLAGIPYTGSGVLGSALAMDKDRAKRVFRASGVPTPDWVTLTVAPGTSPPAPELDAIRASLGEDLIVKPDAEGSTVGLSRVREGEDLAAAVREAARFGPRVLVEAYVPGRELTVAILGNRPLSVVEIIPEAGLYTYEAKYTKGKSRYRAPAELPEALARELQECGRAAHEALGCEGFSRVDFRLPPDGSFQCLEVNTIPGMTPLSLVPMAAREAGIPFGELVERIVERGVERGTRRRPGSVEVGS